jgi:hypothetical protein
MWPFRMYEEEESTSLLRNDCPLEQRRARNHGGILRTRALMGFGVIISLLVACCVSCCPGLPWGVSGQEKVSPDTLQKEHEILTNEFSQIKVDHETLKMQYNALQSDLGQIRATSSKYASASMLSESFRWIWMAYEGPWVALTAAGLALICIVCNWKRHTACLILVVALAALVGGCVLGDCPFPSHVAVGWLWTLLGWSWLLFLNLVLAIIVSEAVLGELDSAKSMCLCGALWVGGVTAEVEFSKGGHRDAIVRSTFVICYCLKKTRVPWSERAGLCIAHLPMYLGLKQPQDRCEWSPF